MTEDDAIAAGGWDPRYVVVRGIVTHGDVAAVLVDPNGDGGSIDVDQYRRGPDGGWVAGSSGGGAGDSAESAPSPPRTIKQSGPGPSAEPRLEGDPLGPGHEGGRPG